MPSNIFVFLDVLIGTKLGGRIVFELFNDVAPRTVENFRGLCTGEYGVSPRTGLPLCYKGCKFFRVDPGFVIQGGDVELNDGRGGESIYGPTFRNESLLRRHCHAGILSMANTGRHTNNSQFMVTLKPTQQLDGRHVVFGRVVGGMDIVRAIEKCPVDSNSVPRAAIIIVDCGQLSKAPNRSTNLNLKVMRENIETLMSTLEESNQEEPTEAVLKPSEAIQYTSDDEEANYEKIRKALEFRTKIDSSLSHLPEVPQDEESPYEDSDSESVDDAADSQVKEEFADRLAQIQKLKDLVRESERLNCREVQLEAKQHADPSAKQKKRNDDDEYEANGTKEKKLIRSGQWSLNEPASAIQWRDDIASKKKKNMENSFGWSAFNTDASYRAHKKRTMDLKVSSADYAKQMLQLGEHFYNPTAVLVSAEFQPSNEAKDSLANFVEKQTEKRKQFRRRRIYNEDETVQYINEFNRSFNKKLERAFGAHSLEIRQNLERGTAL